MFVAAETGKIVRKLTSTASDPHFSSLQFIHSAGAWDSESRRIAIATVTSGRPALAIFDAQSGRKERELAVTGVDEIFNPTWSPDGRVICFTGMSRGLTDLYLFDLDSSTLRALTSDPFADLQPAWSPDGRSIAFATDRFSSRLSTLDIGPYGLAIIDLASGRIEPVATFGTGKNQPAVGTGQPRAVFHLGPRRYFKFVSCPPGRRDDAAHEGQHGIERHHRFEPCLVGRLANRRRRLRGVRQGQLSHLYARPERCGQRECGVARVAQSMAIAPRRPRDAATADRRQAMSPHCLPRIMGSVSQTTRFATRKRVLGSRASVSDDAVGADRSAPPSAAGGHCT